MTTLPNVPEVDVAQLDEARQAGAVLIDVRESDEYEAGHVPGAVPIPIGEVVARLDEVPADGPVYVICETGGRSQRVTQFLRSKGVDARNVAGGTTAWARSGRPAVTGPELG